MMGSKQKQLLRKTLRTPKVYSSRLVRWWLAYDRKYGLKWRAANIAAAMLIVSTVAIPVIQNNLTNRRYRLSTDTLNLVGDNNQALSSKLKYNSQTQTYEFNKEAIKEYNPAEAMQKQAGGADENTKLLYSLDVPMDPKKGVTYHDVNSQLSFKLIPQFTSLPGKTEQGRIVFPLDNGPQAVYTLKNNGLKEDIVVTKAKQDTLRFTYNLELPKSLEAKQLPDGSGAIGIYSADPTLFNNMSYGSDKDRELVEKARENAAKTNLVFGIPAPVITAKDSKTGSATARFEHRGNQLTVVAEKLTSIKSSFSIDPSVIVTSTADFTDGNNEGNIDFSTSGQINRAGLTGGTVGSWTQVNTGVNAYNGTNGASSPAAVAYNGYLYTAGGRYNNNTNQVTNMQYALICTGSNSGVGGCGATPGSIGTWTNTNNPVTRQQTAMIAHNGYLYIVGGDISADVLQYAKVNANGSVGVWQTNNTTYTTNRTSPGVVTFGNYIYVFGGGIFGGTNFLNDIQYAPFKADGSIGSWQTSTTTITDTSSYQADSYNGYAYLTPTCGTGLNNCSNAGVVYSIKLLEGGDVSTIWQTSSVIANKQGQNIRVVSGYVYLTGGYTGGVPQSTIQIAKVHTNGSLGPWQTTSALSVAVNDMAVASYNGYLYVIAGGDDAARNSAPTGTTQYAKIDIAGVTGNYSTTTSFTTARYGQSTVVYGGYLYVSGGCAAFGGCSGTYYNDVQFSKLDATTGAIVTNGIASCNGGGAATWCTSSNTFTTARFGHTSIAYNGYLYIIGGFKFGAPNDMNDVQFASLNSSTGAVGTWTTSANSFITGRSLHTTVVYNGYLYLMGGRNASNTTYNDVQYASISSTGSVGVWHYTDSGQDRNTTFNSGFTNTRRSHASFVANGYVYVMGGHASGATTMFHDIQYALICTGANNGVGGCSTNVGTVGTWNTTIDLPSSVDRDGFAAVPSNDYVYIVGGCTATDVGSACTSVINDTKYARICADTSTTDGCNGTVGTLGTWHTTSSFTNARQALNAVAYNGNLYVLGGGGTTSPGTLYNDVQHAPINNGGGGSTNSWADQGATGAGRVQLGGTTYNGFVYIAGGCTGNLGAGALGCTTLGMQSDIKYAAMGDNGTIGSWNSAGAAFSSARSGLAMTAYNGYVYIIGGCSAGNSGDCTTYQSDIQYALICTGSNSGVDGCGATAGTIGNWHANPNSFSTGRYGLTGLVSNGYMYILGGCSATASGSCTTYQSDIQYALICTGNNSGVGGCGGVAGTVGTWASAGSSFTTGRLYQSATINNGYLYVLGGCSAMTIARACTTFQGDVQYRAIDPSNGTLTGSWTGGTSFGPASFGSVALTFNGYLYLVGGCTTMSATNCGTTQDSNLYAPFSANGMIGDWTMSVTHLAAPRALHAATISKGYLAVLNGMTQTNSFMTTASTAPLQVQPRIGRYSKVIDLGIENARINNFLYNGSLANGLSDISYRTATTALPSFTSSLGAPPIPELSCSGASAVKARYILVTIILDDTYRSTYGETTTANLTDLTVRYNFIRPDPNIRLRLGQTLQQGDLSPFDTCGP
jgi:hypothetical protein